VNLRAPAPVGPGHDARGFDCGVPALNRWLRGHGPAPAGGQAATFVAADGEGRIAGFYTLAAGTARGAGASPPAGRSAPLPVMKLGRLAVDRGSQGRGIGTALVMDAFARVYAVSRHAPVAALLAVASEPRCAGWLKGLGFQAVPGEGVVLFMPLGAIEAVVEARR
jgi:GNAT superfamily N-acetyltransferase